jgi:hypothetical protein
MIYLGKKLVLVAALALVALPSFGCGVGTTQSENNRTIRRVAEYDERMLVDDLGLAVLANRPFHGSRYPIK